MFSGSLEMNHCPELSLKTEWRRETLHGRRKVKGKMYKKYTFQSYHSGNSNEFYCSKIIDGILPTIFVVN